MHRTAIKALAVGLGLTVAMACGDGEGTNGNEGTGGSAGAASGGTGNVPAAGGVGTACSNDSQCTGYDHPACNVALKPLEDFVDDTGEPANDALRGLTLPFPGGYCGTSLATNCTTDAECGEGGGCYWPFQGVSEDVISILDATIPLLDVHLFAERSLCLQECTSDDDCRADEGYQCLIPLLDFMVLINPEYTRTFCMQDVDVSFVFQPAQ